MRILTTIFSLLAILCFTVQLKAADNKGVKKPEPVEKPPKVKPGNVPQPEITITESKDKIFKEYHINGQLRAIKVIPKNGLPPYFLIDHEGSGKFIRMGPDMGSDQQVPRWILFEW